MTYHGRPPADPYPGGDPRRGPRRYGPSAGGDGRGTPGDASIGGRAWSDVGGPAWNDPDAPTEIRPAYRDDPYRYAPPPRGPLPPGPPRTGGPGGPGGSRGPERRRRTPGAVLAGRIIAGIVAVAVVLVSGVLWAAFGGQPSNASSATDNAGEVGVVTRTTDSQGKVVTVPIKGTNILVVGSDSRTDASGNPLSSQEQKAIGATLDGGGVNTDTIMILHIPDGGGKATAISIPRDTWMDSAVVNAPGVVGPYGDGTQGPYKPNKINSFYGSAKFYQEQYLVHQGVTDQAQRERQSNEAGRTMLIKVLQQFTGLKINHYAEVNLLGFYLLSNAIGGVPVCLVAATKDRRSGADFPAGHFDVSGKQALAFVRQRHGLPHGDLDRIRRQQAFLAGAAHKILSVGTLANPGKLSALVNAADRSLVLDKGFDLLTFAQQMIGLTSGNINFVTIPTDGAAKGTGTDALATDPTQIREFFARIMRESGGSATGAATSSAAPSSVDPASVTVDVQNGTEISGMAAAVGQKVAGAGFQRGQLSDYPGVTADNQQTKTTVRYPAGAESAARQVLSTIGVGSVVADSAVPAGHILVVVGTDMPKPNGLHGGGGALQAAGTSTPTAASTASTASTGGAINAADPGCVY